MNITVKTWLVRGARLVIGALLILAGALKLRDPTGFATEIANYQLLPALAPYVAATLPTSEVLMGVVLLLFPSPWRRAAALAATALFSIFLVAVAAAYFRGINIECGCFGTGGGPITPLTLLRNLALIAGATVVLRWESAPTPAPVRAPLA